MKRLKPNQIGPYCSFCEPRTTKAVFRNDVMFNKFACDNHKKDLMKYEHDQDERDSHLTEADYQTWWRL